MIITTSSTIRVLYFGCINKPGHFWFGPDLRRCQPEELPFHNLTIIDGGFLPPRNNTEGLVALWKTKGWTVISWHDRSVDTKSESHSTFVLQGEFSFEDAIFLAEKAFPSIFARFNYSIVEY